MGSKTAIEYVYGSTASFSRVLVSPIPHLKVLRSVRDRSAVFLRASYSHMPSYMLASCDCRSSIDTHPGVKRGGAVFSHAIGRRQPGSVAVLRAPGLHQGSFCSRSGASAWSCASRDAAAAVESTVKNLGWQVLQRVGSCRGEDVWIQRNPKRWC